MKTLLVYPKPNQTSPNSHPALSIFYVGAYLEAHGQEVEYWDARYDGKDDLARLVGECDLVGVSSLSGYQLNGAIEVLKYAHSQGKRTVFGGTHPSLLPKESLTPYVDYVVMFEGEDTMLSLVRYLDGYGGDLEWISGLAYKHQVDKTPMVNKPREDLDLSALPSPITDKTIRYFALAQRPMIQTARGCPHSCGFCYLSANKQSKWRGMPLESIERDLKRLWSAGIDMSDLLLAGDWNGSPARVTKLCELLHKYGARYSLNMRACDVTAEFVGSVKDLGVKTLQIGIESGSPRMLSGVIHKGETIADYVECAEVLAGSGIKAEYFIMRGLPTEAKDDREMSCALADWLYAVHGGNCSISCFYYVPLPGTPLYEHEPMESRKRSLEEWSTISRDSSVREAKSWYWVSGLRFNGEKDGKTARNFPGWRRFAIAPLEALAKIRWKLRFFSFHMPERIALSAVFALFSRKSGR